jgi:mRNA-degrading endonuclease RelE of RelBE toxin-antitoxin system
MPSDSSPVQVIPTPQFQRDLLTLAKRYRRIRTDLQPLINQLKSGELPGDQIARVGLTIQPCDIP